MTTPTHEPVVWDYRRDGTPILVPCGRYAGGVKQLCAPCTRDAQRQYPQGWDSYPGDTCKHGRYVGGSGPDYMCGACESGE